MNSTTLGLRQSGLPHLFARRSAYDWAFALLLVAGGLYAFSRYGAAMDIYEKAILLGALPVGLALGWSWGSLRTLMLAVSAASLLAIGLYGQAIDAYGADLAKGENGFHHSAAFTLQNFHEPIMMTDKNSRILQETCVDCHGALMHDQLAGAEVRCVHCHRSVGHGPMTGMGRNQ